MLLYTNADRAWAAPKACVTNGAVKAACAHNRNAMASRRRNVATEATNAVEATVNNTVETTTVSIINTYVGSFGNLVIKIAETLPAIKYDAVTKTASEVEVNEINMSLRSFIGQLIEARPEVGELYSQVKLARDEKKPALMSAFLRLITTGAKWDITPKKHTSGEQFEDGTVARYDGYTYHIVAARFADAVEVKLQPKSLDDDLAAFGL